MVRDREAFALSVSLCFFFLPSLDMTSLPPAVWTIWTHILDNSHPSTKLALFFFLEQGHTEWLEVACIQMFFIWVELF
jgi:hypothetical protein